MVIEEGVESIGEYAFSCCYAFTSVSIPSTVNTIGEYAFECCDSLHDVYYAGSPDEWVLIDIANGNDTLLTAKFYYDPATITPDCVLPAALTEIGEETFAGSAFVYVKLPDNAVSIGWHAFADCPRLAYIYIPALTTQINSQAFGDLQGLTIIGQAGTTAESYANDHNYAFIAIA